MIESGPHQVTAVQPWFDVEPIPGDAVSTARVTIADDGAGRHYVLATRRRGNPDLVPWIVPGKGLKSFPPVKRGQADVGSHETPGDYRVFALITKTDPTVQGSVHLTVNGRDLDPVTLDAGESTDAWWYDLGTFQVNGGGGPVGRDWRTIGAHPVAALPVQIGQDVTGGKIEITRVAFLPADTEFVRVYTQPGEAALLVVDGIDSRTYRTNDAGALLDRNGAWHYGGIPKLANRDQATRVFVLAGIHGGAPATDTPTTVTVAAWSWVTHVAPPTDLAGEPNLP